MIPSWAIAALLGLGFGTFALAWAVWRYQRPSRCRVERVVNFSLMGAVLIVMGTAQAAYRAIDPADHNLAERIALLAVLACIPLCVAGFPVAHWWAAGRYGPSHHRATEFAEDQAGNADRVPRG